MNIIKFRYNKYPPTILYIMVIFGIAFGFLLYYLILIFSGITKGPKYAPTYFREHTKHAIYLIFGLIPIVMFLPSWIAAKYWGSKEEEALIKMYTDYAILCWKNKEVRIEKGKLHIKRPEPHPHWYTSYILKTPEQRIVLVTSVKEAKEKKNSWLSLDIAMDKLSVYKKLKKGKCEESSTVSFYGINIVLDVTSPTVFENTPYYVDYKSMITIPDVPFVTCMIRERKNPVHVVGEIGIDIQFLDFVDFNESKLKQQSIIAVIELDEQIEL